MMQCVLVESLIQDLHQGVEMVVGIFITIVSIVKKRFRAEKVNNTLFDGLEGLKFNQDAEVLYQQSKLF